ncbi:MAG: c-type cytochrome biogenesis protein CcsB [Nocardioides sp.]|uniref:c-type cytochrome biogenesis protein CcsB n=1 Tax=Nocardioides sp. TaxID=35761 RepID=UPI003F038FA6
MTDTAWSNLSDQALAAAGVVYGLALLTYLFEWAFLRKRETTEAKVGATVATGGAGGDAGAAVAVAEPEESTKAEFAGRLAILLTVVGVLIHGLSVVGRGMAADPNRVPWSNMYEFTLTGTFMVVLLYVLSVVKLKLYWMGPWVVGFALSALTADVVWLYEEVVPLGEALQSPWLVIHVVSAIIATAAFTLGGIASILYLFKERSTKETGYLARIPSLVGLDRISYRMHAFAFPVWTFAVLITGPIWAHQAWSSYWSWDPKEVWAFITWVVYAAYLHARATAGWKGRHAAYLAIVGLLTLWFNFIGINFFSTSSQHSYAGGAEVVVGELVPGTAAVAGGSPS